MAAPLNRRTLERRLAESLKRDREHPSRVEGTFDGVTTISPSGTSYGLAMAVGAYTGEEPVEVMDRVANDPNI